MQFCNSGSVLDSDDDGDDVAQEEVQCKQQNEVKLNAIISSTLADSTTA